MLLDHGDSCFTFIYDDYDDGKATAMAKIRKHSGHGELEVGVTM